MDVTALTASLVCQPTLRLAIESVNEFLPYSQILVYMPEKIWNSCFKTNRITINVTRRDIKNINTHIHDQYNYLYWYSVFMTNPSLWNSIYTSLVLVFQADTLLCHRLDVSFFIREQYDYIGGASLHYAKKHTIIPQNIRYSLDSFFNVGIALHRREWTLNCSKAMKDVKLNEDAKWNRCTHMKVSAFDALNFASDNGYTSCFTYNMTRYCPAALHKPWRHASLENLKELESHCPRLKEMHKIYKKNN